MNQDQIISYIDGTIKNYSHKPEIISTRLNYCVGNYPVNLTFLKKYKKYIDFAQKSKNFNFLNLAAIEAFEDELDFTALSQARYLPEDAMIKYVDRLDISLMIRYQRLSETVIELYLDKMVENDWDSLVIFQKLSEQFINKYKDKLNMDLVYEWQLLSNDFRKKNGKESVKKIEKCNVVVLKQIPGSENWGFYDNKRSGFVSAYGQPLKEYTQYGDTNQEEVLGLLNGLASLTADQLYALDPSDFNVLENMYLKGFIQFACYGALRTIFFESTKMSRFKKPGASAKRRGRPSKELTPEQIEAKANKVPGKRGRPKKVIDPNAPVVIKDINAPRKKAGRPRKNPLPVELEIIPQQSSNSKKLKKKKEKLAVI